MTTPRQTTPGGRTPRRDATENRLAILESARVLLNRDPEASLDAIASGAGLSRRSIYGHFATRDDLVTELVARGSERVIAALAPVDHPDSRVAIALTGARLWSEVENVRVMAQVAIRGPQRHAVARTLSPVRHRLLSIVSKGIDAQELRQDMTPRTLAALIEGSALSVLDEAIRSNLSNRDGHRLVMVAGLAVAGLSWREAAEVIDAHDELRFAEHPTAQPTVSGSDPQSVSEEAAS